MFKKIAMTLGIIFLIGIVIVALSGDAIPDFVNLVWTWVFSDVFGMSTPPPVPFQ